MGVFMLLLVVEFMCVAKYIADLEPSQNDG